MKESYMNFNEKRMHIFSELVKRYWGGKLNRVSDLEELAREIRDQYGFDETELPFIKDHIRLAMGLDPSGKDRFEEELEMMRNSKEIPRPIVSRIEGPCEYCGDQSCRCETLGKYESPLYLRQRGSNAGEDDGCTQCGFCVSRCDFGALAEKIEFLPVVELLRKAEAPVYAVAAPAIRTAHSKARSVGRVIEGAFQGRLKGSP